MLGKAKVALPDNGGILPFALRAVTYLPTWRPPHNLAGPLRVSFDTGQVFVPDKARDALRTTMLPHLRPANFASRRLGCTAEARIIFMRVSHSTRSGQFLTIGAFVALAGVAGYRESSALRHPREGAGCPCRRESAGQERRPWP